MTTATATHLFQVSCSTFHSVPSAWSGASKVNKILPTFYPVGRKDRLISLKCRYRCRAGPSPVLGTKSKSFKIHAFEGNSRHDDLCGRAEGSNFIMNPVKISYVQHESEDSSLNSSKVQNIVPVPCTEEDVRTNRSLAIHNVFKNWLMLLQTSTSSWSQPVEGALEEHSSKELAEMPNTMQKQEGVESFKAVWGYFLGLDAAIKMPLLMFSPLYLSVKLVCGSEVANELSPLWILGPLIVALYIEMCNAICRLYIFCFNQTVGIVKNLPSYCLLVQEYAFPGKLKQLIWTHLWQPLVDIQNIDYKAVTRRKMKYLQGWLIEKYLAFLESIWPYYCRTVRFLKGANLI